MLKKLPGSRYEIKCKVGAGPGSGYEKNKFGSTRLVERKKEEGDHGEKRENKKRTGASKTWIRRSIYIGYIYNGGKLSEGGFNFYTLLVSSPTSF